MTTQRDRLALTGPTTEAGRTFLDALAALDRLDPGAPPVDWAHGLIAVEAEARADLARRIEERMEAERQSNETNDWLDVGLRIVREETDR